MEELNQDLNKQPDESTNQTQSEEQVQQSQEIYPDDNGCIYFGYCKKINKNSLVNRTCYNPPYYMDKLTRQCSQLNETPMEMIEIPKKGEVKETVREQIEKVIIEAKPKTFTVVDIIKQEVERGNKDEGLIFQALKTIFPDEKDSDLRKRIKPTIRYLEKKAMNK